MADTPTKSKSRPLLWAGLAVAMLAMGFVGYRLWEANFAPPSASFGALPKTPYDVTADAEADVAAAAARAKANAKLLLIDFGGNWCLDCRVLAGVMERPANKAFLESRYEIVQVDVGNFDKNLPLAARYGLSKIEGVPAVIIATPDGQVLNSDNPFILANARDMSVKEIEDQLSAWTPKASAPAPQ